ncbi:hypothetical protein ACIRYZ_10975 [Kitasatospora sp. NPDC101155]|uniref:hypothetical protein n=1 Tax=Kitasatospora sp. NPDC101155 TaxID=3364097 RepID=UPI00380D1441
MSDHPSHCGSFQIDADALHEAAGTASTTAARIPGRTKAVLDSSHQAVAALSGLRCAAALDTCTDAWHTLLDDLRTSMSRHGRQLEEAARRYRGTDHQITIRFGPTAEQQQNFVRHFG